MDGRDARLHPLAGGQVRRVHAECRRHEALRDDGFLVPGDDVLHRAPLVVAEIVVETDLDDSALLQKRDRFIGPVHPRPAGRSGSFIVKIEAPGSGLSREPLIQGYLQHGMGVNTLST
jgi:hypothetical protein